MQPTSTNNQPIIPFKAPWTSLLTLLGALLLGILLAVIGAYGIGAVLPIKGSPWEVTLRALLYLVMLMPVGSYLKTIPPLFYHKQRYRYPILLAATLVAISFVLTPLFYGMPLRAFLQPDLLGPLLGTWIVATVSPLVGELVFRGVLQNILHSLTSNIHAAIFINALLGGLLARLINARVFLPAVLFQVLLGYLYWRTKHLMGPMLITSVLTALGVWLVFWMTMA